MLCKFSYNYYKMDFCEVYLVIFISTISIIESFPSKETVTMLAPRNISKAPVTHLVEMGKGLQELPMGFSQTRSINIAYNHLSTLPDYIFYNKSYKALHKIEIYENKINYIGEMAFRGLRQLKYVDLSENNLTILDSYTFKYNCKLETLDLSGNSLNFDRDKHFLVSDTLHTLTLTNNKIDQIYEYSLVGLPKLKNLILDNNIVLNIEPKSFQALTDLQYLSVSNTGVYKLSSSMFKEPPRIIDLTDTPLANKFNPPLRVLKNDAVSKLLNIDLYV